MAVSGRKLVARFYRGWLVFSGIWIVLCVASFFWASPESFWSNFWDLFGELGWFVILGPPLALGILFAVVTGIIFLSSKPT